ncbi:hypothetical protein [uncultured Megasphaera sp.]|uniref:hypothetical protein n=1 Tax=uncultured Megasphaera sp. TaxID=165188 RepID=UPI0025D1B614|nr:hypothetical protein [uncultured Megasphaera sp.]
MNLNDYELQRFTEMAIAEYDIYMRQYVLPRGDKDGNEFYSVWENYDSFFSIFISRFVGYYYCSSASELSGIYSMIKPTKASVKKWFEDLPDRAPDTKHEDTMRLWHQGDFEMAGL